MKHPVSGEIRELSKAEFLALFSPAVHHAIESAAKLPGTEVVVCFECLQLDSSHVGERVATVMGPGRTRPTPALEQAGTKLGDLPSNFKYPVALWRV